MTISSKDMLETAVPAAKSAAPTAAPAKPDMSRLRADAVSLDVPVKVHGSRVTDVVMGVTPHTEPFEEESSTMIVFPHGGVVRMATNVSVGQMLVLTNQKTKQDAICRVVKVRAYSNTQAYVEVEFTHRQSGYWGVHFSSEDEEFGSAPAAAAKAEPAPPPVEVRKPDPPIVSSVSVKVEDIPRPPAPPARPESAFASIGTQEEIQPPAASTTRIPAPPPAPIRPLEPAPSPISATPVSRPAPLSESHSIAPSLPSSISPSISLDEIDAEPPRPSRSFGTLTGGATASPSLSTSDMGTRLGRGISESASQSSSSSGKGLLIAACAGFLVVGVGLGAWYFRQHPLGSQPTQQSAPAESPVASNPVSSSPPETQNLPPVNSQVAPAASQALAQSSSQSALGPNSNPSRPSSSGPHVVGEQVTPPEPDAKQAPMANIGVAVLGAHPTTTAKSDNNVAAPDISGLHSTGSVLPGAITSSSPNLAPPPPQFSERVRVGGNLVPAKLVRSTPPVFPASARQSGIEGDVVVTLQLDELGNVAGTKVVSGLAVFRQPALEAVKGWKYQPATLNGDAVASQVNVTLQFRK